MTTKTVMGHTFTLAVEDDEIVGYCKGGDDYIHFARHCWWQREFGPEASAEDLAVAQLEFDMHHNQGPL